MVVDTVSITSPDGATRVWATRNPDTSAAAYNVFTDSEGLDGGLGVESTKTDRLGDGTVQSGWRRPGRELTISGVWFGPGEAEAREFMDDLTHVATAEGPCEGIRTHGTGQRWCRARLDGDPKITALIEDDWARVTWQLPLYAPDPHLYGQPRRVQATTPGADYGLVWPLYDPDGEGLDWGSDGPAGTGPLVNMGRIEAWPTAVVTGNAASGFRLGDGHGHWLVYRGAVTEQAPVRLDFAAGQATQSGADRTELVTGRGWWTVPAGGQITPVIEPLQQGTVCWADATIYDTYL